MTENYSYSIQYIYIFDENVSHETANMIIEQIKESLKTNPSTLMIFGIKHLTIIDLKNHISYYYDEKNGVMIETVGR